MANSKFKVHENLTLHFYQVAKINILDSNSSIVKIWTIG